MIVTITKLRNDLEKLYSEQFLRLTDIEEDYKYDSHQRLFRKLQCVDQFFSENKLDTNTQLPDWLIAIRQFLANGDPNEPRSCFIIIDGMLEILKNK